MSSPKPAASNVDASSAVVSSGKSKFGGKNCERL
jgi:hypothetical protein